MQKRSPALNISSYSDQQTANTNSKCAYQRAENLYLLGAKKVLEMCVGPSLRVLEQAYHSFGVEVYGNDIDPRWQEYYPQGKWIIGDARTIDVSSFNAVVIAPPLSKNCSGKREDALSLEEVVPSYYDFLNLSSSINVFVLPGKTLSIKRDREQLYKFLSYLPGRNEIVPLKDKVNKYIDVYNIK